MVNWTYKGTDRVYQRTGAVSMIGSDYIDIGEYVYDIFGRYGAGDDFVW